MRKCCQTVTTVLWCLGLLLLLAAAFDVLPVSDNLAIFLGIACFIVGGMFKRLGKDGDACCK